MTVTSTSGLQRGKSVRSCGPLSARRSSDPACADPAPEIEQLDSPTNAFGSKPSVVSWINPASPRRRDGATVVWLEDANVASMELVDDVLARVESAAESAAMLEQVNADAVSMGAYASACLASLHGRRWMDALRRSKDCACVFVFVCVRVCVSRGEKQG